MPPPLPPLRLTVPDLPAGSPPGSTFPGPWVDCSALGSYPEAQLDAVAVASDLVDLETAADAAATVGKYLTQLKGGNPSANLSAPGTPTVGGTISYPIALGRAVRVAPPAGSAPTTPGLGVTLAATNVSSKGAQGAAGPAGASPVDATLVTDGLGGIAMSAGGVGISGVAIVTVNGVKQVQVTFLTPFANANYPVNVRWLDRTLNLAPAHPFAFDQAVTPADGRLAGSVTFALWNDATGTVKDPSVAPAVSIMINCG